MTFDPRNFFAFLICQSSLVERKLTISDSFNSLNSELEGDTYYYMIMGRLIDKRKDQIRYTSNVAREMRIFDMSDVYRLPKFSTKTQKRNNNLDKLGIN